jgi:hypothetical protein
LSGATRFDKIQLQKKCSARVASSNGQRPEGIPFGLTPEGVPLEIADCCAVGEPGWFVLLLYWLKTAWSRALARRERPRIRHDRPAPKGVRPAVRQPQERSGAKDEGD